ncbi:roadblock/LC7 domain-containing protein [Streptomyces sp. NPDC004096]
MTTPDLNGPADSTTSARGPQVKDATTDMAWLLRDFATTVPGVTHALLLSRDGLKLLDSGLDRNWADELAAAFCGLASLTHNITGPTRKKRPTQQILFERDDALFFLQSAGRSAAFEATLGMRPKEVDTVLGVISRPDAEAGTVGFEMERLINRFAPYMTIPVRHPAASDDAR